MTRTHDQAPGIRRIIDRGPADDGLAEVLSPELALVDPGAAAAARATLPERPWDLALDSARSRPDLPAEHVPLVVERAPFVVERAPFVVERAPLVAEPAPLVVESVLLVAEASAAPADAVAPRRARGQDRRRQPAVGVGAVRRLAWMAAWAAMVTGLALLAEVRAPNAPALGASEQPTVPLPRAVPRPVSGARYTIGPSSGFRVRAQGRAIGGFTLPVPCVAGVELPALPVGSNASFSFRGTISWRGGRSVRVWLHGRFTSPDSAAGEVTVRGSGCPRHSVTFVARAS